MPDFHDIAAEVKQLSNVEPCDFVREKICQEVVRIDGKKCYPVLFRLATKATR